MRYLTQTFELGEGESPLDVTPTEWVVSAFDRHQIKASGLDGGTYAVEATVPGDETWAVLHSACAEADLVMVPAIVSGLRIAFSSLGEDAAPVVTVLCWED